MNNCRNYLDRPVFISGFHKSGTTLLLSLLDGHHQLVVFPEELYFFRRVMFQRDKGKALREQTGFKMFLPNWNADGWSQAAATLREGYSEFDAVRFNQSVENALQTHKSDKDLLLLMIKAFAEVDNIDPARKLYWVSKTPREEIFFPVMQKMFGKEFKLIYIVRDARDVYLSISKKKEIEGQTNNQNSRRLVDFSVYWQIQIKRAIYYQKKYDNVCMIRYEDLLLQPEACLRKICHFLQIDYDAELLQPTRHGKRWKGNSAFSKGFQGISNRPIGRFRELLDQRERNLLEYLLAKELALLGYDEIELGQAARSKNIKVPWLHYWVTFLRYQRWYFSKQYYASLRYSFSKLFCLLL